MLNPGQEGRIALRLYFHLCFALAPMYLSSFPEHPLYSQHSLCAGENGIGTLAGSAPCFPFTCSLVYSLQHLIDDGFHLSFPQPVTGFIILDKAPWFGLLFIFLKYELHLIFQFIFSSNFILSPQD